MAREFIMIRYREDERERANILRDKVDAYRATMPRSANGKKRTLFEAWEALIELAIISQDV